MTFVFVLFCFLGFFFFVPIKDRWISRLILEYFIIFVLSENKLSPVIIYLFVCLFLLALKNAIDFFILGPLVDLWLVLTVNCWLFGKFNIKQPRYHERHSNMTLPPLVLLLKARFLFPVLLHWPGLPGWYGRVTESSHPVPPNLRGRSQAVSLWCRPQVWERQS